MRSKFLRLAIRLLGPLLLIVVLWRIDNRQQLFSVLKRADILLLLGAAALNGLNIHCKIIRWQVLLSTIGERYSTASAWRAFLPSMYLGMVTPGRVGDVLRVQYMQHDIKLRYADGLAIIVMDRFCDLYVLLAFVAAGMMHFASILHGDIGALTWFAVFFTAIVPLFFLFKSPLDKPLAAVYKRVARVQSADGSDRFLSALRAQLGRRLFIAIPLTAGAFLIQYMQGWLASEALGLNLSYFDVLCMLSITSLLSLLPISMSGVGLREAFMALAFPALGLGLAAEHGVAFGLVIFAVVYLANIAVGFIAWQIAPPPFQSSPPTPASDDSSK